MRSNEEIVAAFQGGDPEAMEELWLQNERGVQYVADKLAAAGLGEAEDLKQEGFFGLRRAAELYDPDGGASFIGYAWPWIRQAMYNSIRSTGAAIRIPVHLREQLQKYRRFMAEYQQSTGEAPSEVQIRAYLGFDAHTQGRIREAMQMLTLASLEGPTGAPEDGLTLADSIASGETLEEDAVRRLDHEILARDLAAMIEKLAPEKRDAIRARYWEEKPQKSRENQKTQQALRELRRPWNIKRLEPYYFDYMCSSAYKGGVSYFKQKGCSVTEHLAIKAAEQKGGKVSK